jgi:DNA-binding PadR family transcriptional regulator
MSRSQRDLSTTAYAILGLLAIRSWTAYELAQQARRSLRFCWPKSESLIYAEPKRLVRLGLATVEHEPAGRRTRARYAITPAGRQALRAETATWDQYVAAVAGVMRAAPETPASRLRQYASTLRPIGVMAPRPVTTTRLPYMRAVRVGAHDDGGVVAA